MSTGAGASDLLHAEDTGVDEIISGGAPVAARSPMQLFWRRLRRDKVALGALGFIVALIVCAALAGPITKLLGATRAERPVDRSARRLRPPARAPAASTRSASTRSAATSSRACSTAPRCRSRSPSSAPGLSVLIGVTMGLIAGFYRGWVDTAIARLIDILLAFPVLLLGLGLATACSDRDGCLGGTLQPGLSASSIFIIIIANWPYVARIIRGQVLSLREKEFVEASKSLGASQPADHLPRDPPEPRRADHRLRDAVHPGEHPARGGAQLPRRGRAAARSVVGQDALRRDRDLRHRVVVHVLPGHGAAADGARVQPARATGSRTR